MSEDPKTGASRSLPALAAKAEGLFADVEIPRDALPLLRRAGIGRAKGARNRRTQEMRELYLRMGYTHPMLWLGEVLSRPVAELARELQCKPVEALDEQRKAAADLLPYMESRMPLKVQGEGLVAPNILVVGDVRAEISTARRARDDGAMAIDDDVIEAVAKHVQDQTLKPNAPGTVAQATVAPEAQAVDITAEKAPMAADTKSVGEAPEPAD